MSFIWLVLVYFFCVKDYNVIDYPNSEQKSALISHQNEKIWVLYTFTKIPSPVRNCMSVLLRKNRGVPQSSLHNINKVSWILFWVITKKCTPLNWLYWLYKIAKYLQRGCLKLFTCNYSFCVLLVTLHSRNLSFPSG